MSDLKFLLSLLLFLPLISYGHGDISQHKFKSNPAGKKVWITIDDDAVADSLEFVGSKSLHIEESRDGITMLHVEEAALPYLSAISHEKFNRCGGYVFHETKEEALADLNASNERIFANKSILVDYSIDQQDVVRPLIDQVQAASIKQTIDKLSSFKNRYFESSYGVDSMDWIYNHWKSLAGARKDVTVEKFGHSWKQPSVILTIKGQSNETVIVGGHADSISGWFGRAEARAPGADDNASGTATFTEVIRILMSSSYKPQKTIKFMAYAAEEVGLRGSKHIAQTYKQNNENVIGVMQLDMTNYNGSDLDIVMMTDYTNSAQNAFIGNLIDEYIPGVSWGYDKCGYACSDHASWNSQGYPASMPFESRKGDMNRNIHTANDTIQVSRSNADHASKFAKMALAFVVELDR